MIELAYILFAVGLVASILNYYTPLYTGDINWNENRIE